jgi:5'-deoxynucleotidase YfbR-like HD superfamily hydrolase
MLSGRRLDLLDPSPLDIEVVDLARGLARVARWNGQTAGEHAFSVAQHAILVERIAAEMDPSLSDGARLAILLHDAPEFVIGDLITPLKAVIGGEYGAVEARLLAAMRLRFGLPAASAPDLARLTKRADRAAAALEAVRLAGFAMEEAAVFFGDVWPISDEVEKLLEPWPAATAQARLIDRMGELGAPA